MRPLKSLTLEAIVELLATTFGELEDPRTADQLTYPLHDTLLSGFALMFFQHPSLLQFQRAMQQKRRRCNLETIFGVHDVPSDTQMREILDGVEPEPLRALLPQLWEKVRRAGWGSRFTTTLPSGSEHKGLGGELAVEPFVTAAIALGPFDLLADASYKWTFDPEKAQEFDGGLAAAWPLSRWFTPFIELRATKPTVAEDHRPQVAVVPGLNMKPFPRSTLAVGVQLPVTSAREFDYQVRVLFIREF